MAAILRTTLFLACLIGLSHGFLPVVPSQRTTTGLSNDLLDNFFSSPTKVQKPEGFVPPEPKPLQISESTDKLRFAKSTFCTFGLRLGVGAFCLGWRIEDVFYKGDAYSLKLGPLSIRDSSLFLDGTDCPRPEQPLVLYEYESSPFCKRVRETMNLLDLTVEYRPCPGARQGKFSDELYEKTGKRTVPYLYDPNTDTGLFESDDQIEYLLQNYGPSDTSTYDRKALWPIAVQPFSVVTSTFCALLMGMPGKARQANARPDNEDMVPLELWGNEASPFVRTVRESMGSLCLPHVMVSCARGSPNRDKLVAKTGRFQVPYLIDPNTGVEMFESEEIVAYLNKVYTV